MLCASFQGWVQVGDIYLFLDDKCIFLGSLGGRSPQKQVWKCMTCVLNWFQLTGEDLGIVRGWGGGGGEDGNYVVCVCVWGGVSTETGLKIHDLHCNNNNLPCKLISVNRGRPWHCFFGGGREEDRNYVVCVCVCGGGFHRNRSENAWLVL